MPRGTLAILAVLIVLALFAFQTVQPTAKAQDASPKATPELKVLAHYVGQWDVAVTRQNSGFLKGEAKAEWILDGQFVEQTGVRKLENGETAMQSSSRFIDDLP